MQQGGSQYGVPPSDMTQFTPSGAGACAQMLGISGPEQLQQQQLAEAASPISSRPPPPHAMPRPPNFEELVPTGMPGGFADDDALAAAAGEEAERGGVPGNRWPRQETLALLKIRSEMDTAFRDATLKGPLWEDVSRKLAELGYTRSAKKCKEKFENVHKYYKRTKEGRAGRQDGKSYRFFTQLEALHSNSAASSTPNPTSGVPGMTTGPSTTTPIGTSPLAGSSARLQPSPISAAPPPITTTTRVVPDLIPAGASAGISSSAAAAAGTSFSSNTSSSSSSESDDEETEEGASTREGRKRKHRGSRGSSRKMIAFFKGLMKQVMERQDAMQKQFLETIEKREQDRMIREEAWRRQEMVRLSREHELMAQDRAMAASRDAAVISFLQKISGQTIQLPPATVIPAAPPPQPSPIPAPPPATQHKPLPLSQEPPQPQQQQPPPPQQQHHPYHTEITRHLASSSSDLVPVPEPQETAHGTGGFEPGMTSSSRWPKSEVHALIKLRSGLESRYQEAGPKGPLWEEISSEMQKLGYNRTSKRCKEKWENINKYFKKVKESNKKRPDDAKTCPYFHQLEALYRKKLLGSGSGGGSSSGSGGTLVTQRQQEHENNPNLQEKSEVLPIVAPQAAPPPPRQQPQPETEVKSGNNNRNGENTEATGGSTDIQQTSNGDVLPSFFEEGTSSGSTMKKPEDIMKELMEQQQQTAVMDDYDKLDEPDSNDIDQDDDDDDEEDDEDRKMQYKIQFQRQNVGNGSEGDAANASAKAAATSAGSFLAMVQ